MLVMKGMKLIAAALVVLAIGLSCNAQQAPFLPPTLWTLDGQVFIRTGGGETIKLSLVDVRLFDAKVIADNVESKRTIAQPIYEALQASRGPVVDKIYNPKKDYTVDEALAVANKMVESAGEINGKAEYLRSGFYYLNNLPTPIQKTTTDADGKFTFKVPNGSYALVAASRRSAGAETEFYHWMIRFAIDADRKVVLANDNLSTSGSSDSMISTVPVFDSMVNAAVEMEAIVEKAQFSRRVAAAQQKAVELYPEVGVAGSALNREFLARMKRYQIEKREFFAEPDWPVRLGKECNDDSATKPATNPK